MDYIKHFARDHDRLELGLVFFTTDQTHTMSVRSDDFDMLMASMNAKQAGQPSPDPFEATETFAAVDEAARAFRRKAESLLAEGFVEVEMASLTGQSPQKADWKRALDTIVIAVGADLLDQAELIAAFASTAHGQEPQFVWAQIGRDLDMGLEDAVAASARLAAAEALIQSRLDAGTPLYGFMRTPRKLASEIARLRVMIALQREDQAGALAAAKAECAWESSWEAVSIKLSLQIQAGGQEQDAAFDELYANREIPTLAPLTHMPGFADYAAGRDAKRAARRADGEAYEWSEAASPASAEEIAAAEAALGLALPRDYKDFLRIKGLERMSVEDEEESSAIVFLRAGQLVRKRDNFRLFTGMDLTIYGDDSEIEGNVGLDELVPIADCAIQSNSILLQPGDHDRYFVWFHDSKAELYPVASSFAELIYRLQRGVPDGDRTVRAFFEFLEEDE